MQSYEHFKDALKVTLITMITMQLVDMAKSSRKDNWWTTLRLLSNFVSSQPPEIDWTTVSLCADFRRGLTPLLQKAPVGQEYVLSQEKLHLLSVSTKSSRTADLAQVPPAARRPRHQQEDEIMDVDFFWVVVDREAVHAVPAMITNAPML